MYAASRVLMAHPRNIPPSARNHEQTQIYQNDPFIFQQGPGVPDPLPISAFPTIPQGIYSSFPVRCDGVNNPVSTGSVESCGHGYGYLHATRLGPSDQALFKESPEDRNDLAEPAAWSTPRIPLDQPLQEGGGPVASPSNDGGSGYLRTTRIINNEGPSVTPVYRCRWQGCQSHTNFRRPADLLRHLKTIHIAPEAFPCPKRCGQTFGRKDHLDQHMKRRH